MDVRLAVQPEEGGETLSDFLYALVEREDLIALQVAVAWAKESGLTEVEEALLALRAREVRIDVVAGIDAGGATRQGLEGLLRLADEVHILHNDEGRTFHPKVFLALGEHSSSLWVGSHNLTLGGTVRNYEAALCVDLDHAADRDKRLLEDVQGWLAALVADEDVCKELTPDFLQQLLVSRYQIKDEGEPREARDETGGVRGPRLFTRSTRRFRQGRRRRRRVDPPPVDPPVDPPPVDPPPVDPPPVEPPAAEVVLRWYKQLGHADAQRPENPRTNATGHVTLTKNNFAISSATWFRNVLFRDAEWVERGVGKEQAVVEMDVWIGDEYEGSMDILLTHKPSFQSGQGNRTTVLHWGTLTPYLAEESFVGSVLTLEQLSDGSYRLHLAAGAAGPSILERA